MGIQVTISVQQFRNRPLKLEWLTSSVASLGKSKGKIQLNPEVGLKWWLYAPIGSR